MRTCGKCLVKQRNKEFRWFDISKRWSKWCAECREHDRVRTALYVAEHPEMKETNAQRQSAWLARNPELSEEYKKRWRGEHVEERRAYMKRWRAKHAALLNRATASVTEQGFES